jgi:hypothetical protein
MNKFEPLKDKHIVSLLKKHYLYNCAKKGYNTKTQPKDSDVFAFISELLSEVLPTESIKNFYYGFDDNGITSLYAYAQIDQVTSLYNDLKTGFPLFEIGFKRCNQKHIQRIIESELQTKFEPIGSCMVYSSLYILLEEPKHGILLSLYTQENDMWPIGRKGNSVAMAFASSAYTGLIIPGFDLTYALAEKLNAELDNNEIEFPYNRLGAVSISQLTKENVTPKEAKGTDKKVFVFESKVKPKVKTILESFSTQTH